MSKVRAGWAAALERAALMIEAGYPAGSPAPDPTALVMSLRALKYRDLTTDDMVLVGVESAGIVFRRARAVRSRRQQEGA